MCEHAVCRIDLKWICVVMFLHAQMMCSSGDDDDDDDNSSAHWLYWMALFFFQLLKTPSLNLSLVFIVKSIVMLLSFRDCLQSNVNIFTVLIIFRYPMRCLLSCFFFSLLFSVRACMDVYKLHRTLGRRSCTCQLVFVKLLSVNAYAKVLKCA